MHWGKFQTVGPATDMLLYALQIMKRNSAYMLFAGKAIAGDKENSFIFPPNMIPQYLRLLEKYAAICMFSLQWQTI